MCRGARPKRAWNPATANRPQTPGAPLLQIINTGTNAVAVVWPSTPTSFVLQQNADLNTTNWVSVGVVPNDDGTNRSVTISPAAGNRYFRLRWP